ncbi:MAG: hypothetical protein HQL95_09425, partial [Magnetococcales bacterium]|nr:hypothetical protein [Magnetococcales bacterium]
ARLNGGSHPPGQRATLQLAGLLASPRHRWQMTMRHLRITRQEERIYFQPFSGAAREQHQDAPAKGAWEMVEFFPWCPYDEERRFAHPDASRQINNHSQEHHPIQEKSA